MSVKVTSEECFNEAANALREAEKWGGTDNRLAYSALSTAWRQLGVTLWETVEVNA